MYEGINLDTPQIKGMLSYDDDVNGFPEVWDEVRALGDKAVEALVFISIIFSHHMFIEAFSRSKLSEMRGCLKREDLGGKIILTWSMPCHS